MEHTTDIQLLDVEYLVEEEKIDQLIGDSDGNIPFIFLLTMDK